MRWVQRVGLIPLRSRREYPKIVWGFSRTVMSLADSSFEILSLMITGDSVSQWRKAQQWPVGKGFNSTGGLRGVSDSDKSMGVTP